MLVKEYGFSQLKTSKILGMKQPAVNYLITGRRRIHCMAVVEKLPELKNLLDNYVAEIASGKSFDPCEICKKITNNRDVYNSILRVVKEL